MRVFCLVLVFVVFFFTSSGLTETDKEKIKKIDDQLISLKNLNVSGVLDDASYQNAKKKLVIKKNNILNKKKKKKPKSTGSTSALNDQLKIIKKLFDDGVLSEEEYLITKKFLEEKEASGENIVKEATPILPSYELNVKKDPGKKAWEKAEIIFKNYKIITYRPGGIKVVRISDNETLLRISDNFKIKYYKNAKSVIETKATIYTPPSLEEETKEKLKEIKDILTGKIDIFEKKKTAKFDKDAHKLELFIEGTKILHFEGRYVKKHRAYFYQVLTSNFQPFHFYIKLRGKTAIALNMEFFNMKIDRAVRKVKKELSAEYDVTEEQIEQIINKKIGEEADKAIQEGIESAISESVQEAIAQSIGQAMSQGVIDAIEKATGEAISQALEDELAKHIDEEIQKAIQDGIEEAAVAAGFQAYYDTLLSGGSVEEALRNAGEACGEGCEFELK